MMEEVLSQFSTFIMSTVHSMFNLKLLIVVPVLFLLFVFELLYMGFDNSAIKRIISPSKSSKLDIALSILYVTRLTPIITVVLSFGLCEMIPETVKKYFGYNLIRSINSEYLKVLIYFFIYDFIWYWKHRLSHKINWWWELHKIHHSATELNFITANRIHPFDEAVKQIFMCIPLAIVGAEPEHYVIILIFTQILLYIQHSMLPWKWGWVGDYIFVSPLIHRIHHSPLLEHIDKNFGNITPIWDHIFGTWYGGEKINMIVGVQNNDHNQRIWYLDIWYSYIGFWKQLLNALVPGKPKLVLNKEIIRTKEFS